MNNIKISNVLNSLPLIFEKNIGQHDEKVQFALNKKEIFFEKKRNLKHYVEYN